MLAVFKDADQAHRFYGEVQKKLTESLKALLGLPHLRLWEGRPVVARVLDLPSAIHQIAYFYANPARANLVDSIDSYPGCSSWDIFQEAISSHDCKLNTTIERHATWVPYAKMPLLPSASLRKLADTDFTKQISKLGIPYVLELQPNAWMKCLGVSAPDRIREINKEIAARVIKYEAEHRESRAKAQKGVLGERQLRVQPITRSYVPKDRKHRRRVYVICSDKTARANYIHEMRALRRLTHRYYQESLQGIEHRWPPGMFKPPLRPLASAIL
jgi:hypothetical protein